MLQHNDGIVDEKQQWRILVSSGENKLCCGADPGVVTHFRVLVREREGLAMARNDLLPNMQETAQIQYLLTHVRLYCRGFPKNIWQKTNEPYILIRSYSKHLKWVKSYLRTSDKLHVLPVWKHSDGGGNK